MRRIVAGIGGIGLAAALSQFPEYAQQYTQRLGGAVDELRVITEDFDRGARSAGLSREEALLRYDTSADEFLAGRGQSMGRTFERYRQLSAALAEIEGATPMERLASLPLYLDTDIGKRTLESYRPAMPVTLEGTFYALGGFILGYLVLSGLVRLGALAFRRRYPRYRRGT